jgi:dihydropyrimidinase
MATDYSPYHGMQTAARPIMTMLRGRVVVKDGVLVDERAYGRFVSGTKVDFSRFISGL